MANKALVFLNGTYPPDFTYFYVKEIKQADDDVKTVVTDGGLQFFVNHKLYPDIIVGDSDSSDIRLLKSFPKAITITVAPDDKNLTDGEMALDWCVKNQIADVVMYGGIDSSFETDQLLGNIFMMYAYKSRFDSIKMRDYCQEIIPLENETWQGIGKPGALLSMVPLSDQISYEGDGLKYDPSGQIFSFGDTRPLRNEIAADIFNVTIRGRGVLIMHY